MKSRGDILVIGHAGWFRTLICGWEKRKKAELLQIPFGYGQVYERKDFVFDALISAAGRSSRMGVQTALEAWRSDGPGT